MHQAEATPASEDGAQVLTPNDADFGCSNSYAIAAHLDHAMNHAMP